MEGLSCLSHIPTPKAVSHTLPGGGGDEGFSRLQHSPLSLPQGLWFPLPSWGPEGSARTPSGIAWTNPYTAIHLHSTSSRSGLGGTLCGPNLGIKSATLGIWDLEDVAACQTGYRGGSG